MKGKRERRSEKSGFGLGTTKSIMQYIYAWLFWSFCINLFLWTKHFNTWSLAKQNSNGFMDRVPYRISRTRGGNKYFKAQLPLSISSSSLMITSESFHRLTHFYPLQYV
ncbi:hypothetical protein CsSME_00045244 [Camellia sinensis var. sinensis]